MGLTTTDPGTYPVTLAEVKDQVQSWAAADVALLTSLRIAATEEIQNRCHRQIITATSVDVRDSFPEGEVIYLRRPPLISVTSIQYVDTAGDNQTFAASKYRVDTSNHAVGRVTLEEGQSWPTTDPVSNAVTITYTSGYGASEGDGPEALRRAILLQIEDLYEGTTHNEDAIARLIAPYEASVYA